MTHDEAIRLIRGAHALNVREHPCLNTELNSAGDDGGDDLRPEHGAWRNLHVMAELKVGGELQRLGHRDVPPCLEHHHGDGASRERIADDQLRYDAEKEWNQPWSMGTSRVCILQTNLLVRDSLDHTDRNRIDEGYARHQRWGI